eukprot:TRINITY_DN715_c0_g1_i3.p1 TRINITY_DN715_c0_g1~~TRINITY_DN715_c0_g1_i3.p1  ORF type:complete len:268 (+),score=25.21 TRINITY_DN715_c0_g1_i3:16-819(+)
MSTPVKAILSYTGGKDCTLSLHLVHQQNNEYTNFEHIEVVLLVTFVPAHTTNPFRAHPLHLIKQASQALGIQHRTIQVAPPYIESYREKIRELKEELEIKYFVTGDVEDVCDQFTKKAVAETGVELLTPLWQRPRDQLLALLWKNQIQSMITCVNLSSFGMNQDQLQKISTLLNLDQDENGTEAKDIQLSEAEQSVVTLAGSIFNEELCGQIQQQGYNVDRVGEFGEFHTVVTNCRLFSLELNLLDRQQIQRRVFKDVYCYVEFPEN